MGTDEHGEAYPEPPKVYRCPICHGDENRYLTCEYPGCFDGRDRGHPHARVYATHESDLHHEPPRTVAWATGLVGWAAVIALLLYIFWPHPAPAMDHGFDPNSATTKWFETLQRPDRPGSCCGKADAYPVTYKMNPDGSADVTVTDGSDKVYPDGYHRPAYTGGVITVPKDLINPYDADLGNTTDTSWIFMTVYGGEMGSFYCLIRHPEGG